MFKILLLLMSIEIFQKYEKKKFICQYCNEPTTNFIRHLERNHSDKEKVKNIMSLPVNSMERIEAMKLLRNDRNFINFIATKTKKKSEELIEKNRLPCEYCKGLFSKKYLARHSRNCKSRLLAIDNVEMKKKIYAQSVHWSKHYCCGKRCDFLITSFGENYLKNHKSQQIVAACSSRMRQLARLLTEMRSRVNHKKLTLANILSEPKLFDSVIDSVRHIAGYDIHRRTYVGSASLAMHYAHLLKSACDVYNWMAIKEHEQITNEISSLVIKDLTAKRMNTVPVLPLTEDVVKFRQYVIDEANKAEENWRRSVHTPRKLLQKLYHQQEMLSTLTASEQALAKHYKRIISIGKGSRPVIILFPEHLQVFMDKMLQIRNKFVPISNNYLFAFPDQSKRWVRDDKTIKSLAIKSGVKDPSFITGNTLRKQIATVTQILNLTSAEMKEFSKFMSHTEKTHEMFYILPQDVYQCAIISKLLLMMDRGTGKHYAGKNFDEIDINLEIETAIANSDIDDPDEPTENIDNSKISISKNKPAMKKKSQRGGLMKHGGEKNVDETDINLEKEVGIQNSDVHDLDEPEENVDNSKIFISKNKSTIKKKPERGHWTKHQKKIVMNHFKVHVEKKNDA
ncbi:hypothetical protein PGB90_002033 [Kerria lacca]